MHPVLRKNIHTGPTRSIPAGSAEYAAYMQQLLGDVMPFTGRIASRRVAGLATPHIDHERGRESYRDAYALLKTVPKPDVLIALGTCHRAHDSLFHLTRETYQTPLGPMPTHEASVERLIDSYGATLLANAARHSHEWSIELGSYILQHCWHASGPVDMVPILVTPLEFYCERLPTEIPAVSRFITALTSEVLLLEQAGKKVLLWAPVDLSHRGANFDASDPPCQELETPTCKVDGDYLNRLVALDSDGAFELLQSAGNPTRIDAMSPCYILLEVLKRTGLASEGHLLGYHQSVNHADQCMVTHASLFWH